MAATVYFLCAALSFLCTLALVARYRATGGRILFWSSLCFGGLLLNNVLLFIDMVILPTTIDLRTLRTVPALLGVMALIYGCVEDLA